MVSWHRSKKEFVRNWRWRIITAMKLSMSFIDRVGVFRFGGLISVIVRDMAAMGGCGFVPQPIKKLCHCWGSLLAVTLLSPRHVLFAGA